MFDRYTEGARRTLFFARDEAFRLRGQAIEPEHLLLGLVRSGDETVGGLLARVHVKLDDLRHEIEIAALDRSRDLTFWTRLRETVSTPHEIPFSPPSKFALKRAAAEADRLQHRDIGPGHLLLGILSEARSVASTILSGRDVHLDTARAELFPGD